MSDMERNKGKLIPTGTDTDLFQEHDFDTYRENGFEIIDGEIYRVEYEVESETDVPYFADVKVNEDGSIDFHTYGYNGAGHWTELVEDELEVINESSIP